MRRIPGGWPSWCLLPAPVLHMVLPGRDPIGSPNLERRNALIDRVLGLYAWHQGRTVWRFDPDTTKALVASENLDTIPAEVLRRLPQWGVYIQMPDGIYPGETTGCEGVLARLTTAMGFDFGAEDAPVLEIQYDVPATGGIGETMSLIPLVDGIPLADALELVRRAVRRRASVEHQLDLTSMEPVDAEVDSLRPWLALLMYLCSKGADLSEPPTQREPEHRNDHRSVRSPAKRIDVGFRIGAAIRRAGAATGGGQVEPTGRTVAPHLRRAHFHTFYSGKGSRSDPTKRRAEVRWLPPIPVGVGEIEPVVRPVD